MKYIVIFSLLFFFSCSVDRGERTKNQAKVVGDFLVLSIVTNASYDAELIDLDLMSLHKIREDLARNEMDHDIQIFINSEHLNMFGVPDIMAPRLFKIIYKNLPFVIQIGDHDTQSSLFEWDDVDRDGEHWTNLESILQASPGP